MDSYTIGHHMVHMLGYRIVWATKYRRDLITEGIVDVRLRELVHQKATERGWDARSVEIAVDHVNVLIYAGPMDSPNYIAAQLKGITSNVLRNEFPALRSRVPTLWTRSYLIASVGADVQDSVITDYLAAQRTRP